MNGEKTICAARYATTTDSTNSEMWRMTNLADYDVVFLFADEQTAGRGQGSNKWESEAGKNLLFSVALHPTAVPVDRQFALSMAVAIEMTRLLRPFVGRVKVKWPNDIYVADRKIAGILIENSVRKGMIATSVVGIGLNVNQTVFRSGAPNPVSIKQLTGQEVDLDKLRNAVIRRFLRCSRQLQGDSFDRLKKAYMAALYRRVGYHTYRDEGGEFLARIVDIAPDGRIVLADKQGTQHTYAFKEVEYVLPDKDNKQQTTIRNGKI